MKVFVQLDSGTKPNVLSPQLVKSLSLRPVLTNKVVKVTNGNKSDVFGKVVNVPVLFQQMEATMDFVVPTRVPFDLVIGRPALKRLGGVLDFKRAEVGLDYRGQKTWIPMVSEFIQMRDQKAGTSGEDFTSGSDDQETIHEEDGEPGEEDLVLTIEGQKIPGCED